MPPQHPEETKHPAARDPAASETAAGETDATKAGATQAEGTEVAVPEDISARMRRGLVTAMKARDQQAVAALRSALARIDNAEAVDLDAFEDEGLDDDLDDGPAQPIGTGEPPVAGSVLGVGAAEVNRRVLTPEQMAKIVHNEVTERETAADLVERVGHPEQAKRLRAQAKLLTTYLDPPAPPPPEPPVD